MGIDTRIVSAEPLPPGSLLIRAGPDHHKWGDPYDTTMVLTPARDGQVAQIVGLCGKPTPSIWRDLRAIMREHGIDVAEFRRGGAVKIVRA